MNENNWSTGGDAGVAVAAMAVGKVDGEDEAMNGVFLVGEKVGGNVAAKKGALPLPEPFFVLHLEPRHFEVCFCLGRTRCCGSVRAAAAVESQKAPMKIQAARMIVQDTREMEKRHKRDEKGRWVLSLKNAN
jgi:hypothetical protein